MAYFGKSWKVNRWETGEPETWEALGKIKEATPQVTPRTSSEVGTDSRTIDKVVSELSIGLDILMLLQRWDYLMSYAIITAEGAVPAHILRYTDGQELKELQGAKVNTCEFRIPRGEAIKVNLSVLGKDLADFTTPTWASWTERVATWKEVTLLTLGDNGADLKALFREIAFGVDNHIAQEYYGQTIKPQEVEEAEATYSASVVVPRKNASQIVDALAGTEPTFVIAIKDLQDPTPETKTFTFSNCSLGTRIEVRGLGIELEAITLEPESLAIT